MGRIHFLHSQAAQKGAAPLVPQLESESNEPEASAAGPLRFSIVRRGLRVLSFWKERPRRQRRQLRRHQAVASMSMAAWQNEYDEESSDQGGGGGQASSMWQQESKQKPSRGCFPLFFQPTYLLPTGDSSGQQQPGSQSGYSAVKGHPQCLIACGSRLWGSGSWMDARSLLNIRVYDFALYVDSRLAQPSGAHQSNHHFTHHPMALDQMMRPPAVPHLPPGTSGTLALEQLLHCPEVPVSVVLRAARDIPLDILQSEMRGVLERRYQRIGGSAGCKQLEQLLDCFGETRLPAQLVCGRAGQRSVCEGATMAFSRAPSGALLATAFPGPLDVIAHTGTGAAGEFVPPLAGVPVSTTTHHEPHQHHPHHHQVSGAGFQHQGSAVWHHQQHHNNNTVPASSQGWGKPDAASVGLSWGAVGRHEVEGPKAVVPLVAAPLEEPKLSLALLDLYLGAQPVSKKAKATAVTTLSRLCADGPAKAYLPSPGQGLRQISEHPGQPAVQVVQL